MTRTLADQAVQSVLEGRDVVVLATLTPGGAPLAMPMWFVHDEHRVVMVSVDGLGKVRNLRRDPRLSVVAEGGSRSEPHGLVLAGEATFFTGSERLRWAERFRAKYTPDIERLWQGSDIPDNRVVFGFEPRVVSAFGV